MPAYSGGNPARDLRRSMTGNSRRYLACRLMHDPAYRHPN
jgi:hypothetical protein